MDTNALQLALSKEVLNLTDEDIAAIIAHHRAERARIAALEAAGKKPSKPKPVTSSEPISIDDILKDL
jgi:hypothetical protein